MIHVIAAIELKPGTRENFLMEFARLVPQVRAEGGCIAYGGAVDVQTDLPVQGPARPNVVTAVEQWESLAALKAHLAAPHMSAYREHVKDYVLNTTIQILKPAGEPV